MDTERKKVLLKNGSWVLERKGCDGGNCRTKRKL